MILTKPIPWPPSLNNTEKLCKLIWKPKILFKNFKIKKILFNYHNNHLKNNLKMSNKIIKIINSVSLIIYLIPAECNLHLKKKI